MFAENLKTLRKARGLSQEELAIRLNVVRQTVSKWEKGLSVPDADLLIQLAEILEVSVTELLGARIENEQELNAVAEQLSRINEQLAIRNRRSRRIWQGAVIVLAAFVLISVFLIVLSLAPFYAFQDGEDRNANYSFNEHGIGVIYSAPQNNPISIMVDGTLYITTGEIISEVIEESSALGHIMSNVPITDWPTEHAQTNFDSLYGEPFAAYQDGIAVRLNRGDGDRWILFRCRDTVLAEDRVSRGGLWIGRYISEDGMSWVWLVDSISFYFNRHSVMSYMPTGEYSVADGKLTLTAGGNEEYVFLIRSDGLELELKSTHIEGILEQGMLFTFSEENDY